VEGLSGGSDSKLLLNRYSLPIHVCGGVAHRAGVASFCFKHRYRFSNSLNHSTPIMHHVGIIETDYGNAEMF
jgi:hypothetical protein